MFVVCCVLFGCCGRPWFGVCYVLCGLWCSLSAVGLLLFEVRCVLLFVACGLSLWRLWFVFVVYGLLLEDLLVVVCCLQFVVCCSSFVLRVCLVRVFGVCGLLSVVCCLLFLVFAVVVRGWLFVA